MSCNCGPGATCGSSTSTPKKEKSAQQIQKNKQYVLFGTVMSLFLLRWFHIVDSFLGIDVALLAILIGSTPIYSKAVDALLKKKLDTNVLIGIAILAALAVPSAHTVNASWLGHTLNRLFSSKFFPAGSVIVLMLTIETLEIFTLVKMKSAVDQLIAFAPKKARVRRENIEEEIDISLVKVGDIVIVKSGETIPVDGTILQGNASVNQSTITGEGLSIEKYEGTTVMGGTICELGAFEMSATKVGENTAIARVIRLLQESQKKKPKIQKYSDKMATIFIPTVLVIAAFVFILTKDAVKTATVLLVACPCALSMATPAAVIAGIGNGARRGILIKGGLFLEAAAEIDCVVFDKTGTLTFGKPEVTDVYTFNGRDEKEMLCFAASAEKLSEHPLSSSILQEAKKRNIQYFSPDFFKIFPGKGILAILKKKKVLVGNLRLFKDSNINLSKDIQEKIDFLEKNGKTILIVAIDEIVEGLIAVADILKEDAHQGVKNLRNLGIKKIVLLSGDNQSVSEAIGNYLGVDEVRGNLLPEDKVLAIEELKKTYKVAMVGDGINDTPALSVANIAIAMGSGTDVSIEAADIILKTNNVRKVEEVLKLGKKTLRTIKGNIIFSMAYNVLGIALSATGIFVPALAVIFQEAGCFSVMLNSALLIRSK